MLLPFSTTYLRESSMSALAAIKTENRARLHVENDIRVCLSTIAPEMDKLLLNLNVITTKYSKN